MIRSVAQVEVTFMILKAKRLFATLSLGLWVPACAGTAMGACVPPSISLRATVRPGRGWLPFGCVFAEEVVLYPAAVLLP